LPSRASQLSNGQKIRTLINAEQSQGEHELIWNGSNDEAQLVSSGIYFVKMTTSIPRFKTQNNYEIKKIIMLK
jgi:flagellar hook assembly protein FlgD